MIFFIAIVLLLAGIGILAARKSAEESQRMQMGCAGMGLITVGIVGLFFRTIVVVDAGMAGVVKTFGKVSPNVLPEGLHMVNPFADVVEISVRTQEYTMSAVRNEGARSGDDSIRTLSRDGLPMPLDVTITFRANASQIPWLYRTVGTEEDFVGKIIRPASRAAVRDAISQFTAQEAYSTKREMVAVAVTKGLEKYINDTLAKSDDYRSEAFVIQQVLIRNIELPDKLKQSIEAKLTAEQEALRMEFTLQKEKQEAERKRIEARGIADFQAIVSQGLNDKLLQWKGIEATQELAKSENAKIVIVGSGKGGLPIILNTDGSAPAK